MTVTGKFPVRVFVLRAGVEVWSVSVPMHIVGDNAMGIHRTLTGLPTAENVADKSVYATSGWTITGIASGRRATELATCADAVACAEDILAATVGLCDWTVDEPPSAAAIAAATAVIERWQYGAATHEARP